MKSCLRIARYSRLVGSATLLLVVSLTAACSASTARWPNPVQAPPEAAVTLTVAGQAPAGPATPTISATFTATRPAAAPTPKPPTPAATLPSTPTAAGQPGLFSTTPGAAAQTVKNTSVKVSKTVITLPTYPFRNYLVEQLDPVYNIPVFYFDRPAYEAAAPTPSPTDYTGVVLENAYLRLTFLPELGGRLYSAVVKATGQEIFYHNPVVKPSRYGVLQPAEANWWLATGGMEWAYPTQEHGYRWGIPWRYDINQNGNGVTITLSDVAPGRVGAAVSVTLPADSAAFTVSPRLVNNGSRAAPVQFWLNAALTLGGESMSRRTEFIVPTDKIIIHSRGEVGWSVADAQMETAWPQAAAQVDLREYRQWTNYLGFFVPYLAAPFMGAYNPATDLGVVRLIEPGAVPGSKLFAFGLYFTDRSYTDDDSQYFEIWGGANTGFWPKDDVTVPAGGTLQWQESWWPLAGLGGVTWANQQAAIHLNQNDEGYTISLRVPRPRSGTLAVLDGQGAPLFTTSFTANPAAPQQWNFTAPDRPAQVQIKDDNSILLDYHQPKDSFAHD